MSYIHQALKKAQLQRDDRRVKYGGITGSGARRAVPGKKAVLLSAACLAILFLAFASYSWLDSGESRMKTEARPTHRAAPVPKTRDKAEPGPRVVDKVRDAEKFYGRGRKLHREGRLDRARTWYEKALQSDPGYVPALNNLGVLLLRDGKYPAAQASFEKAIRLRPDYVDPCYNLACLFALTDRPGQAMGYLKRAIAMEPKVKAWARKDRDLKRLRGLREFWEMIR